MTGLRIVAATIIVLVHWRGQFGIPVLSPPFVFYPLMSFFFVLSGFVQMYRYSGLTRQQVCSFLGFRIARLWPMHLVSLGFVAVLVPRDLWWNELCTPGAVLAHVFMIHTWLPFQTFPKILNGVSWSVSTELFLYCCFPILVWKWRCTGGIKLILTLVVALALVSRAGRGPGIIPWQVDPRILEYVGPLTRLWEFVLGMTTASLWLRAQSKVRLSRLWATALEVAALVLAVATPLLSQPLGRVLASHALVTPGGEFWLQTTGLTPFPFAFLIFVFALEQGLLSRLFALSPLVLLGEISYSLYLMHLPLVNCYQGHFRFLDSLPVWLQAPLAFAMALAVAYLCWSLIEVPCRRYWEALGARLFQRTAERCPRLDPASPAGPMWRRPLLVGGGLGVLVLLLTLGMHRPPRFASLAVTRGQAQGHLDCLGPVPVVPGKKYLALARSQFPAGMLVARGWAVGEHNHHAVRGVFLQVDDQKPVWVRYGCPRPDVAAYFKEKQALRSGFEVRLGVNEIGPGAHTLSMYAVLADINARETTQTIELVID